MFSRKADEGVGRGPGVRPTSDLTRTVMFLLN
jgi:hypothetical protein